MIKKNNLQPIDIGIVALTYGIGTTAYATIFPMILKDLVKIQAYVGYYFSVISFLGILVALLSTKVFSKYKKTTVFKINILVASMAVFIMSTPIVKEFFSYSVLDITRAVCITMLYMSMTLLISDLVSKDKLDKTRADFSFFISVGGIVGPIVGGYLATNYGNRFMFGATAFMLLLSFFYFVILPTEDRRIFKQEILSSGKKKEESFFSNLVAFFSRKEFIIAYLIAFGLSFWFNIKNLYYPLALKDLFVPKETIGYIMAASNIPFMLIPALAIKLSKQYGDKFIFIISFLMLSGIFYSMQYFTGYSITSVYSLSGFFVLSGIAGALSIVIRNEYFFAQTKKGEKDRFFGIYYTSSSIAGMVAPIIASFLMTINFSLNKVNNLKSLWFYLTFVFLIFVIVSLFAKSPSLEKRKKK
jgi:MFS family permease